MSRLKFRIKEHSFGIFLCTSAEKTEETVATLRSLIKYAKGASIRIVIYIIGSCSTQEIEKLSLPNGITIEYVRQNSGIDRCESIYPGYGLLKINSYFKNEKRVLYLSSGVEICGDILPVLQLKLGRCALAAAPFLRSENTKRYIDLTYSSERKDHTYVNTDVLLIQLRRFEKKKRKLEKCILEHSFNAWAVQDSLNKVFAGKIKLLDICWSYPQYPQRSRNRNEFFLYEDDLLCKNVCPIIIDRGEGQGPLYNTSECLFSIITVVGTNEEYSEGYFENIECQIKDIGETLQIILMNSGMSEKATMLCEEYKKKYPEIIDIYCDKNKSGLSLRNEGALRAKGRMVCFLDECARLSSHALLSASLLMAKYPALKCISIPVRCGGDELENMLAEPFSPPRDTVNLLLDYGARITEISSVLFHIDKSPFFGEANTEKGSEIRLITEQIPTDTDIGRLKGEFCLIPLPDKYRDTSYLREYFTGFWLTFLQNSREKYNMIPYHIQFAFLDEMCKAFAFGDTGENFRKIFWKYASKPLELIDDSVMIDALGMRDMSRIICVLGKKYQSGPLLRPISNDIQIVFGDTAVGQASYQSVIIHFIKIKNNVLTIEGETSLPKCFSDSDTAVYADVSGNTIPCRMSGRFNDKKLLGEPYEYCEAFSLSYTLSVAEAVQIRFYHMLNGEKVAYHSITGLRFSPVSNEVQGSYAYRDGYILRLRGGTLECTYAAEYGEMKAEAAYRNALSSLNCYEAKQALRFRRHYFYLRQRKKKPIWLFFDRIDKADDNGEAMFRYVKSLNNESIDVWFVIGRRSKDYKRLRPLGGIVAANSFKHRLLHSMADYIFTSQLNGYVENPFGKGERFYRDLYHQPKIIFLQHGVTKDDQTRWLNRYNQDLTALVVSSERERASFLELPYYYGEKNIWLCGMPRLDRLYHDEKKQILIMPTWRRKYMEQRWNDETKAYRWYITEDFRRSGYVSAYHGLLNSSRFLTLMKEYGYTPVFMPHPIVQPYISEFSPPEDVTVYPYDTSWRTLFAQSDLMITDYSSVAFDFAWLEKPIIYYQFDRADFFASHTYKEGYFDYEKDGFGEIAESPDELLDVLEKYLKNGCQICDKYKKRIKEFYSGVGDNCCKRIYEKVSEFEKTGV